MLTAIRHHWVSEEEYLRREREALDKSEYYAGAILAMAGGRLSHNRMCSAVTVTLGMQLRGRRCQPYSSDQRLMTPGRLYTYPDLAVYRGQVELRPGTTDVATNPTVLVEVLSDSTREYDTGDKLQAYQQIPSLQHVLLVEPDEVAVTVVSRENDAWSATRLTRRDAVVRLPAIGVEFPLSELYADLLPQ